MLRMYVRAFLAHGSGCQQFQFRIAKNEHRLVKTDLRFLTVQTVTSLHTLNSPTTTKIQKWTKLGF
jgi:hypothetical protein